MNWLFNTPSQSVYRVLPRRGVVIQAVHVYATGQRQLIVTGDHAAFWMEGQTLPAAFAAVLLDDHGRYTVKFAHLQLARQDAQVTLLMSPDNADLQFTFQDIEDSR